MTSPQDICIELIYRATVVDRMYTAPPGLRRFREIFDASLGRFLEMNQEAELWEREPFRDFIFVVVDDIARRANAAAAHANSGRPSSIEHPTVTREHILDAARAAFIEHHPGCKAVLRRFPPPRGIKVRGDICPPPSLDQLERPVVGAVLQHT